MPKVYDLPPVPANPEVSPPVILPGEEPLTLSAGDGSPRLEALLRAPENPRRTVVLFHPHPLYGGTMHSAVVLIVAKVLAERAPDVATLRFNFRGVGRSEGTYDQGNGEVDDARLAIRTLSGQFPSVPSSLCAYSFGTWVGLRAAAREGGAERIALIAPAVRLFSFVKEDATRTNAKIEIFLGDDDMFCDVSEGQALGRDIGAKVRIFEGSDHYFLRSRRKLGESVVPFLVPELSDAAKVPS